MDQQLKKNALSLTMLQIGQYLVPLIILPYLTRVLGAEGFGLVGFATAFTVYFVLVVEWGFNLAATRQISVHRHDKILRSTVFWETLVARWMLTAASVVMIWLFTLWVPRLHELSSLLWIGLLQILSATLSTGFYYQGTEKMRAMALINLGVRALSIPLIMLFVHHADQVLLAFAIQAGCFLLASLVNLALLIRSGEIAWVRPGWKASWRSLVASSSLFWSSVGTSLYTNSNVIILGFVASESVVGYFVAGFSLVRAVVAFSLPMTQAVFPRASLVLSRGTEDADVFLNKMLRWQGLLGLLLSIALLLFAPWGVTLFYGAAFEQTALVVAWLSALPLLTCIASALGMQILVALGQHHWYAGVLLACGVMNGLLLAFMGHVWGAVGAAIAVLITECVVLIGMAVGVRRYAPHLWRSFIRLS